MPNIKPNHLEVKMFLSLIDFLISAANIVVLLFTVKSLFQAMLMKRYTIRYINTPKTIACVYHEYISLTNQ